jgi:competence ComEA-like helix-hairpin-helix protein
VDAAEPVDVNLASEAELRRLPGIGPKLAERIIASRTITGSFPAVADLVRVPGVTAKLLARLDGLIVAEGAPRPSVPVMVLLPRRPTDLMLRRARASRRPEYAPPAPAPVRLLLPAAAETAEGDDDFWAGWWDREEEAAAASERAPARTAPPPSRGREVVSAAVPWKLDEAPPPRPAWAKLAAVAALALAAAGAVLTYSGRDHGYAKLHEVETWAAQVRTLRADQEELRARVEPVAAQLPATAARIDALSATVETQQRDAERALTEAHASIQRLNRELASLRDTLRKDQKDAERRLFEMRVEIETHARSGRDAQLGPAGRGALAANTAGPRR